jgi:predicted kinase
MTVAYILVGMPGYGKSTWIANMFPAGANCPIILSTDNHIERFAYALGLSYNEGFKQFVDSATTLMHAELAIAVKHNLSVVWDQTNLTVAKRKMIIKALENYHKVAVVFDIAGGSEEWARRRANRPGKVIPRAVLQQMQRTYVPPTFDEGFDDIIDAMT